MNNEQLVDKPYLVQGEKTFTRREIADEIRDNSSWGISFLSITIMLAIEIMASEEE